MPESTPVHPVRRRVIVAGGLGALGIAVAQAYLAAGHRVAVIDRAAEVPAALPAPGDQFLAIGGIDLTDPPAAERAVAEVAARFGGIDTLVNVAGAFQWEPIATGSNETWRLLFETNVITCATMCRAVVRHLEAGGRIINVGAAAAASPSAGMGPYAAAKSAVASLTKALAAELSERGITVNAVLPSIIDTEKNRAAMPDADRRGWVAPQSIADVILYLSSDAARAITAGLIPVTQAT